MNPQDDLQRKNSPSVPPQLRVYPLIRVCKPNCFTHTNFSSQGKRPVTTVEDSEPLETITNWIDNGGNVGVVARSNNDLVIIDSDSKEFSEIIFNYLPETFTVESGGSNFGEHIYYKSDYNKNKGWNDPEGSIRSTNWMCVCPPSSHESGGVYTTTNNTEIAAVSESDLKSVVKKIESSSTRNVKRGGGGGSSGSPPAPSSHRNADLDFIKRDDIRADITEILHTQSEHNRRVWMVGWLHGAAGLAQSEITDIIMDNARWSNLDREIVERQVESVIDSSYSGRGTHYSEWGYTADMDGNTSERRKTESEGSQPSDKEEVNNMEGNEDNVRNKVTVKRDDGQFARGGIVQVENNGDEWEYAGVVFGQVEGEDDELGQVVEFETNQYGDRDYRNIGDRSPEELRLAAEALEELADEIEG